MDHSTVNEHQPKMYQQPGEPEFIPEAKKLYHTFTGTIVDTLVPNVEVEPIFSMGSKPWGKREPVDFARGQQLSAEIKLVMEYWSLSRLKGRIILCPVGTDRDYELLHRLIEGAYVIEGAVGDAKQKVAEVSSLLKGLFGR